MCNDKNDGNTSFAVERNLLSGNAVIFHVQQHLFCYIRSHLGEQNVCFERDVTALNTLTSHESIQPDRA